jgi:hypothetical protein
MRCCDVSAPADSHARLHGVLWWDAGLGGLAGMAADDPNRDAVSPPATFDPSLGELQLFATLHLQDGILALTAWRRQAGR